MELLELSRGVPYRRRNLSGYRLSISSEELYAELEPSNSSSSLLGILPSPCCDACPFCLCKWTSDQVSKLTKMSEGSATLLL